MPQIFQVLRCYKCLVFQVHQTKKSNKWECKLCGEKQSVKRHYGIGTAKDCRMHVQKLNCMRGEKDELKFDQKLQNQESDDSDEIETIEQEKVCYPPKQAIKSKWTDYVEEKALVVKVDQTPEFVGDAEVVLEIPKKRRKQFRIPKLNYNTTAGTQSVDTSIEYCNKKTYEPSYNMTEEKEITNTVDVEPTQDMPSDHFQLNVPFKSIIEKENFKPNIPCKKIIQPVVCKSSKWAEYVEEEEYEEPNTTPFSDILVSQKDHLFSQCDESELDSVLDI